MNADTGISADTAVAEWPKLARSHFSAFLDHLYAAALDPALLASALEQFAVAFSSDHARLFAGGKFLTAPAFGKRVSGHDGEEQVLRALRRWQSPNLAGNVLIGREPIGGYLALLAETAEGRGAGFVAIRQRPFSEDDRRAAQLVVSDLTRAFRMHHEARMSHALALATQLFAASTIALVTSRQKSIDQANEVANRLAGKKGPITLFGRTLCFQDARVQAGYDLLSRNEKPAGSPARRILAFVVPDQATGESWLIQIARLAEPPDLSLAHDEARAPLILTAITPLHTAAASRGWSIAGFSELTGMERTILSGFVDGKDLGAIAGELGRSVETVRWHVKNLFTKLNVNSHRDLARLGSLLLPI